MGCWASSELIASERWCLAEASSTALVVHGQDMQDNKGGNKGKGRRQAAPLLTPQEERAAKRKKIISSTITLLVVLGCLFCAWKFALNSPITPEQWKEGFGQAQGARQQDIANRFGLAQAQQGLGAYPSPWALSLIGAADGTGALTPDCVFLNTHPFCDMERTSCTRQRARRPL